MKTTKRGYESLCLSLAVLLPAACAVVGPELPEPAPQTAQRVEPPAVVIRPSRLLDRERAETTEPAPPADVFARLRGNFSLPASDDEAVRREFDWYAEHAHYVADVLERSRPYLHYIAEALEERGMPADLALLPVIESAFDPFAYSRGRASGLWQIIPGTGEMLGLKQNWWYDGRRDVVDSTRAALDYLERLHDLFDGDWLLAIAGYNSGEGHVGRAIERARREDRPVDYWSLRPHLRAETAAYVPKLLAIRDLVARAEDFDLELPVIDNAPHFAVIPMNGQIDVARAAEIAGLSVDALYALNPGINRWATDPDGPHRLVVPVGDARAVEDAITALPASERVRWTRHRISRGETLIAIARRYRTTPAVLRQVNELSGNVIRAGAHLMVPHATASAGSYTLSVEARTLRQQDRPRDGERIDYAVRPGDSLWSISRRFDVSTGMLAAWNSMAPGDVLSVGRRLVIWSAEPAPAAVATQTGPSATRRVNYIVRHGDSLAAIAGRFRISVAEILDWNGLSADRYLQPGQSLVLYVDVTEQST